MAPAPFFKELFLFPGDAFPPEMLQGCSQPCCGGEPSPVNVFQAGTDGAREVARK